jgi:signal peptidase II
MVYFLSPLIIILADVYSKKIVCSNLNVEEKKEIIKNKLYFWHRKNYGFPFSICSDNPKFVKILTTIVFVFTVLSYLILIPIKGMKMIKLFYAVAVGGAASNLFDRIKNGCVTDFIFVKIKNAPIFNLADIAIFVGVVSAVLFTFTSCKKN